MSYDAGRQHLVGAILYAVPRSVERAIRSVGAGKNGQQSGTMEYPISMNSDLIHEGLRVIRRPVTL